MPVVIGLIIVVIVCAFAIFVLSSDLSHARSMLKIEAESAERRRVHCNKIMADWEATLGDYERLMKRNRYLEERLALGSTKKTSPKDWSSN